MTAPFLEPSRIVPWGAVSVVALVGIGSWHYMRGRKAPPLPPGPRGLPLIGNLLDAPTEKHWVKFAELGDIWGDILSLNVFGQTMIIVNSVKVAEDLLDVRGANFSERPVIPMGGELCGFNNALILSQPQRQNSLPLISTEVQKLLSHIASNQAALIDDIRRMTGGIALRIAYGYQLQEGPERDPLLQMFETTGHNFSQSTAPGAFLVDLIPILRHWPEWLPGGGFHTTARRWSKQLHETVNAGLEYVRNQMNVGTAETSFVSTLLEEKSHEDYLVKWAAASIEEAGSDTTAAQLEAFFLAMSIYPDVQMAAQEELERVVGRDRLPDLSDRAQLPYINALCKEVFRWHVASPTGVPHRTHEEYIYLRDGNSDPMLIPKDSLIIANIWKMTHDPERYADPLIFNPSRFITTDGKEAEMDPSRICFGYGRRICPGKLLADNIVFLTCSAILSVFKIFKALENGVVVEPELGQMSGTVSHPLPFKCVVEPRDARALALIRSG
ncbi:Cytochrome P450 [Mycena sanguinolenta]|uniref:Cytochrome P450 n=1 Tax=Mycena sanguinolenta TaxID=230812 RepID=A0A8H6YH80_9AGAR|nr:Cytochrome P450 [Mycena sanguinolenta]